MKQFTRRLQEFTYPRDVPLPSFATVGNLKILMMGNATSVLSSCIRYSVTDCVIQGKIANEAKAFAVDKLMEA